MFLLDFLIFFLFFICISTKSKNIPYRFFFVVLYLFIKSSTFINLLVFSSLANLFFSSSTTFFVSYLGNFNKF